MTIAIRAISEIQKRVSNSALFWKFVHFTKTVIGRKNPANNRSHDRYRRIALSSVSSIFSRAITAGIGVISVPLTISYLGKVDFGIWMVTGSLIAWIQLADFGVTNGITNVLSEAYGKDDFDAAGRHLSTALLINIAICLLALPLIVLASIYMPWGSILNVSDPNSIKTASQCFLAAGTVFSLCLPFGVLNKLFQSFQLGYIVNIIQIISSAASLISIFIAVWLKLNTAWFVALASMGPLLGGMFTFFAAMRYIPEVSYNPFYAKRSSISRIADSSIPIFIFQIGALAVNQVVNIIIAHAGSLSMVADYNILLKIYMLIFSIGASVATSFYPAIREAFERQEFIWVTTSIRRALLVRLSMMIILSCPLIILGDWIILKWIHQPIEGGKFGLFGWFSFILCLAFSALSSTMSEVLTSLDDIWSQTGIVFINAIIVISLMWLLIPRIGLAGVYIAFTLSASYPVYWTMRRLFRKKESWRQSLTRKAA